MDIGWAIDHIKQGGKIARAGWNGQGMWVAYSPGHDALPADKFWAGPNREYAEANGGSAQVRPSMTLKAADGTIVMGWHPSMSDALAEDWEAVD